MTNPILERAARAAYDHPASFAQGCWVDPPEHLDLASVVVDGNVNLIEIARAVLKAVREIDKPLWLAGMYGTNGLRNEITPESVSASHAAIIDAILGDNDDA